jgi:hypothetical protein
MRKLERKISSAPFPWFLLFVIVFFSVISLFFAYFLINRVEGEYQEVSLVLSQILAQIPEIDNEKVLQIIKQNLIARLEYPVIFTKVDGTPVVWRGIKVKREEDLKKIIRKMNDQNPPLPIKLYDPLSRKEEIIGYVHFSRPWFITLLQVVPLIQMILFILFVGLVFLNFRTIKTFEQTSIWAGLAKETAHQLSTPISGLIGWTEILKPYASSPPFNEIYQGLVSNLDRLKKMNLRFGDIGSQPKLEPVNPTLLLKEVISYYRDKIPHQEKGIVFIEKYQEVPAVRLNPELFKWVLENLIRNGLDALPAGEGRIEITLIYHQKKEIIEITVADNGRGIETRLRGHIFTPGFTTKKKGWGIGLFLSKKIVEHYHGGKLELVESKPGQGTKFKLSLFV